MKLVLCNCPPEGAAELARALVEGQLAACVNIIPAVRSLYQWEGRLCDETESTLLIKAPAAGLEALRAALVSLHPYEVPEILVLELDLARSHAPYVDWVRAIHPSPEP